MTQNTKLDYSKCRRPDVSTILSKNPNGFTNLKGDSVKFIAYIPEAIDQGVLIWLLNKNGYPFQTPKDGHNFQDEYIVVEEPIFWLEGEPIYEGREVYCKSNPHPYRVVKLDGDLIELDDETSVEASTLSLTKPNPILATLGGVPLRAGDKVYRITAGNFGKEYMLRRKDKEGRIWFDSLLWSWLDEKEFSTRKPLGIHEGKIIFKGDTLYGKTTPGLSMVVMSIEETSTFIKDCNGCGYLLRDFTWDKPKPKPKVRIAGHVGGKWSVGEWESPSNTSALGKAAEYMNDLHGEGTHWVEEEGKEKEKT